MVCDLLNKLQQFLSLCRDLFPCSLPRIVIWRRGAPRLNVPERHAEGQVSSVQSRPVRGAWANPRDPTFQNVQSCNLLAYDLVRLPLFATPLRQQGLKFFLIGLGVVPPLMGDTRSRASDAIPLERAGQILLEQCDQFDHIPLPSLATPRKGLDPRNYKDLYQARHNQCDRGTDEKECDLLVHEPELWLTFERACWHVRAWGCTWGSGFAGTAGFDSHDPLTPSSVRRPGGPWRSCVCAGSAVAYWFAAALGDMSKIVSQISPKPRARPIRSLDG